ncbi:4-hydroxy-tetrahydrodipicolinate synthase [Periweissella fabaria]|uniref:4-hydroxy-tetrahydrodipicolinate synthase n=1 Tax=Periweissella fabaria TaxID=546157 RepID=A0ABM8Z6J8_9LACO|nr:4-hydroxy-tetrahydrodipicolinate synthase [Periweissella fabaria]MCM0596631.1 4-hydroxy-tetrahydrodipicolinate synthase [Periweissella fabaria]CAH0416444.1 4-hydroxy-tetrahydrodipicolinate synthase [Periweissella fabaria]
MLLKEARVITAIITPFTADNKIDFPALETLTNHLLAHGSDGFVIGGTTGEGATMSDQEKIELYREFVKIVAGRGPIIANIGTNNTAATIEFGQKVAQIPGIDGALAVVPYYNKPNQKGLIAHFTAIADNVDLPLMVYNIPGRSTVKATVDTILTLAKHPRITALKQCTDLDELAAIIENAPADFAVYTGEDGQALAAKALGTVGVVSVASHLYGDEFQALFTALDAGDVAEAGRIQRFLNPKVATLFSYPSPTPVKAALTAAGFATGGVRLPLVDLDDVETAEILEKLEKN